MIYILFVLYMESGVNAKAMTTAEFANSTMCEEAAAKIKQLAKYNQTLCLPKGK